MGFFTIDEDRCLNYNYKRTECHNCRDICPQQCWDETGQIWPERCNGCGLCQSVCPVDAIGVEGIAASAWNELAGGQTPVAHLSCRRHGAGPWACLGFLNARDLVALSGTRTTPAFRQLVVYHSHCRECRPAVAERLEQEISAASDFLAQCGVPEIQSGDDPPMSVPEPKVMTRRGFFDSLLATGMETARNIMQPEAGVIPLPKGADRADILRSRLSGNLPDDQKVFPVLHISPNCIACGLCAKMCPVQALTATDNGQFLELWQEPMLCTGCGLCRIHCPVNCITLEVSGPAAKQQLIRQEFPKCNECGQIFKPAGQQLTCFDCLLKGRQSIFGP